MQRFDHGGDVYSNEGIRHDFSININPLGMPSGAKKAIADHIGDYERYPDPHCRELRAAIAARHGVADDMVLCGNGAAELLFRICACFRPRSALTLAPTFSEYGRTVKLFGGEIREHHLTENNGFELTEAVLPDTMGADVFFLCNPNNPTGRLSEPSIIRRLAEACMHSGTLLVIDECFMDFTGGESAVGLLRQYPNLFILRAFTKIYAMAGLRLGYLLCADGALLSRVAAFGAAWNVSVVAQEAGLAAIGTEGWLDDTRRLVEEERAFLARGLTQLGFHVFPSEANYLLFTSEEPLYEALKARGILLRPCENFTGLDDRYYRIGIKTHDKNEALLRAMERCQISQ